MSVRVTAFSDGFTSASAPSTVGAVQENYTLLNNQSTTNITGLLFPSSETKTVFFQYELERIGTVTYRQSGSFMAVYNGSWTMTFGNYQGDDILESTIVNGHSVILTITSGGQIQYSSGNHVGFVSAGLKVSITRVVI